MKVLLLGLGMQGKAVVHDLEQSPLVTEVVVADKDLAAVQGHLAQKGFRKARAVALDATDEAALARLIRDTAAPVVICMLLPDFGYPVARAAIEAGVHFVSSSYTGRVAELDAAARQAGITVLPEMGMDPGIDLVLARLAIDELDEVHGLYSYGSGLPEPACADDNPLHYKITWTFEGVLKAYSRPARVLKDGQTITIDGRDIFLEEHGHTVEVPGLGPLEAYPNGDAIHYIEVFKLGQHIRDMGRFALRYPGHRRFWSMMARLGFLDDTPLDLGGVSISPRRFLVHQLTPQLQFSAGQRDLALLRVEAWGLRQWRQRRITYSLLDYRDLSTGLFAMNRTVGYTTSIGAQMILSGTIDRPGVLTPAHDVPARALLEELKARGMTVERRMEEHEVA